MEVSCRLRGGTAVGSAHTQLAIELCASGHDARAWGHPAVCARARLAEGEPCLRGSRLGVFDPFRWARRDAVVQGKGAVAPLYPLCCYGRSVVLDARRSFLVQPGREHCTLSYLTHGRRSMSSLRRPPQEDAASLNWGGARKHGRSGATVGEPRPSARNPAPSPEGKVSRLCRDG